MPRKCYARALGNCSPGLSREHYISRAVLKDIGGEKAVWLEGLQHQNPGVHSLNSLTSKILCRDHNNALSDLDSTGAAVARTLRHYQTALDDGKPEPTSQLIELNGSKFERWLLKIVFGMAKATQVGSKATGTPLTKLRSEADLVQVLFGLEAWPPHWGVYLNLQADQAFMAPTTADGETADFGMEPASTSDEIWSARFWVRSIPFLLAFGRPGGIDTGLYRPGALSLSRLSDAVTLKLVFTWADKLEHFEIPITRQGTA